MTNPKKPSAEPSSVERDLTRLRTLQRAGRHADAIGPALKLSERFPENRDVLIIAAHSQRHLGRIDDALVTLARLDDHHPGYSLLHEERGLCHVARKHAPEAIESLLRAVNINPALPMSWRILHGIYRMTGDLKNAANAATHVEALKALPHEIVAATGLFADGELAAAETVTRNFLVQHGDQPEAMRLLAKIGVARDVLDDAEVLFAATLELAPEHRRARYEYADCLLRRHKYVAARDEVDRLLVIDPDSVDYRALRATAAVGLGDHATAITMYRDMLKLVPGASEIHLWLGHALKTVGELSDAIAAYRAAAVARPDFGDAYWSLANLKTYRFTAPEIEQMRLAEQAPKTTPVDRYHLCFALGKANEDCAHFTQSWMYYERGNALKRADSDYQADVLELNTTLQIETCTPSFFTRRKEWGDLRPDPIFIVGLPRSGSTLIEQVLASHSQVEGTQELPDIQAIVHELQGREMNLEAPCYPGILTELGRDDFAAYGERYLADTRVYRTDRRFFIDKMPNNFRHIGFIHAILPNAKIIDARREPMACCFSNLKQLFSQGQEFTYSVDDIERYYRTYVTLMEHWDVALPGRVLRVQHDDVINDIEGSVRRILAHCGLSFEPGCVSFHENKRSVRTPSAEQVRRPISRDGVDQWRNYEPWLDDLKTALTNLSVI